MFKLLRKKSFKNLLIFDLLYQLAFIVILLPFAKEFFSYILKLTKFGFFYIESPSIFAKSPTKIWSILIIIFSFSIVKLFEVSGFIFTTNQIRLGNEVSILEIFNNSYKLVKSKIKKIQNYLILILVSINIPISTSIHKGIKIPNFITEYILNSTTGIVLFTIIIILAIIFSIILLFVYHIFFLENKNFIESIKISFKRIKQNIFKSIKVLLIIGIKNLLIQIVKFIFLFVIILIFYMQTSNKTLSNIGIIAYLSIATILKIFTNVLSNTVTFYDLSKFYFKTSTNVEFSNIVYPTNKIKLKMSLVIIFLIFAGIFSKYRNSNEEIKFYHTFRNLKPDIMAHRGSTKNSAENTLESINEAIQNEAEFAEIDVVLTKDNVVVLSHDHNLKRLTGKKVNIEDLTFEELKNYKIIDKKNSKEYNFVDLQTVLEKTSGKIKLNIELKPFKNNEKNLAKEVTKLIKDKPYDVIVSSLSPKALKEVKDIEPNIPTGLILAFSYGNFYNMKFVDFFCIEKEIVTNEMIRKIQKNGKRVYIWTANTHEDITKAYSSGADGIITDEVTLSKEILELEKNNFNFEQLIINKIISLIP
ncbi:glycerophosphodiester phosphodiesterase family protein [Parvimonas micra]